MLATPFVTHTNVTDKEIPLPVEKKYSSNAQRQAAYRARHPEKHVATDGELAALARSLHAMLTEAVEAGTCPLPPALVSERTDQTLRNLIRYLDPDPDPVRYSGSLWEMSQETLSPRENLLPREV